MEVVKPECGLSLRGTADDKLFSGDVVRKLSVQMEQQVNLSQPVQRLPQEPSVAVKVRERASRRAVKHAVDEAAAEAQAHQVATQLVGWYNQHVGVSMLKYACLGRGRRLHILDTTHVEVALETGTYECSGVVKNDDGTRSRGYKLATLRTLLDSAGLLTQVAMSAIRCTIWPCAVPCWRRLQCCALVICSSNSVGLSMGVVLPLEAPAPGRCDPPAQSQHAQRIRKARQLAQMADKWQAHPSQANQTITLVRGVEHMWTECEVPLNACVIRLLE